MNYYLLECIKEGKYKAIYPTTVEGTEKGRDARNVWARTQEGLDRQLRKEVLANTKLDEKVAKSLWRWLKIEYRDKAQWLLYQKFCELEEIILLESDEDSDREPDCIGCTGLSHHEGCPHWVRPS